MDGWMDGWMMAREEDGGGRRKRVEARLDDASRLFGRVSQIGRISKSDQRLIICRKVQISVEQRSLSLHSRSNSGSAHCIRSTGTKLRSQAIPNIPTSMLKSILPYSALVNAESEEGTISTSNQSRSVYVRQSLDNVPVFTQTYPGPCGCHQIYV